MGSGTEWNTEMEHRNGTKLSTQGTVPVGSSYFIWDSEVFDCAPSDVTLWHLPESITILHGGVDHST